MTSGSAGVGAPGTSGRGPSGVSECLGLLCLASPGRLGGEEGRGAGGSAHPGAHSLGADVHVRVPGWSSAGWRGEGAQTEPPRRSLGQDEEWWARGAGGLASGKGLRAPLRVQSWSRPAGVTRARK